jgi:TorA maturation chaperone TorD
MGWTLGTEPGAASDGLEMREGGFGEAIRAAGSVGVVARPVGIPRPAVPSWKRISSGRAEAIETITGASPSTSRAGVYPMSDAEFTPDGVDEIDLLRSYEYGLLATLFGRAPNAEVLARLSELKGDTSPLGLAHIHLAEAAAAEDPDSISREYFDLFIGVGRGELLPFASYYLAGFLHERPLARLREDLRQLGIERAGDRREPEDHIAILCEVMAGLSAGRFDAAPGSDRQFFERHLKPWAGRFFADCETSKRGRFYRVAGAVGRLFLEIEAEAFSMDA